MSSDIRQAIRDRIEARGFNISELADRAGFSRVTLSRYLSGQQDLTTAKLQPLIDVLGLELRASRGRPSKKSGSGG